jgi:ABC-type Na+ efflux pump permease subunit
MGKEYQPFVEFLFPMLALVACLVASIAAFWKKRDRCRLLFFLFVSFSLLTLLEKNHWGPSNWPVIRNTPISWVIYAPVYFLGAFFTWALLYFALRDLATDQARRQKPNHLPDPTSPS